MKPIELALLETDWWDSLSRQEQINYLKEHKNSKFKGKVKKVHEDETKSPEDRKIFEQAYNDGVNIPPAWSDIKYFGKTGKNGIIAIGRDAQGRQQRIEDAAFRERKVKEKHEKIRKELSPKMDEITENLRQLAKKGNEEAKVLYLITQTAFRIGDKQGISRKGGEVQNTYGASSLLSDHVKVSGNTVKFNFVGKGGVYQNHEIKDPVIAKFIKDKLKIKKGNERLFDTTTEKIRKEWKNHGGDKVHDIRSYIATKIAKEIIENSHPPENKSEIKAIIKQAAEAAANKLGNKPAESLKTYIDQSIFEEIQNVS